MTKKIQKKKECRYGVEIKDKNVPLKECSSSADAKFNKEVVSLSTKRILRPQKGAGTSVFSQLKLSKSIS